MLNSGQTNQAIAIVDQIANSPSADAAALLQCAQVYVQLGQVAKLEPTLVHLTGLAPTSPEAWYDLAGIRVLLGKRDLALESLTKAIELSNQRLAANPQARNLRDEARKDSRFTLISGTPEFQKLMSGK
jgi:predicted Zn-dependent protease